jgi:predicted RNA binding protein YcfA (HicA-like mRNA interferase family)
MTKYPIISGKRLIKALLKEGYIIHKGRKGKLGKGSHISIKHPNNNKIITIVPNTSKDLTKGLLVIIRRQLNLSKEEFIKILSNS